MVYSEEFDQMVCSDNCIKGYFLFSGKCYKCDDSSNYIGNKGCDPDEGCSFNPNNNELDCVKCKEGYYKYLHQCFACSLEDPYCDECYFDESNENKKGLKCNKCKYKYEINYDNFKCKPCEEQPDISIGCMICEDKMNDLFSKKQCEYCKPEFFLTKDKKCFYCKARTNGGPACSHCNDETNKCDDYCNGKMYHKGKCYDIEEEFGIGCASYGVNESANLYCIRCKQDYSYSNGYCVYNKNYCLDIPKCTKFNCIIR
jgi:hypothetical protein